MSTQTQEILYRDDSLVAVHKPAGLLVHRSDIDRHETRFAVQMLHQQLGAPVFPVHRLDKPTSGVLLFALNSEVARLMGEKFVNQQIEKRYIAVVRGHTPPSGHIDHPIKPRFDKYERRNQSIAKPAVTDYQRLASIEIPIAVDKYPCTRYSLLDLLPRTGRKHQLRHHMKHISHPIIGDAKYGKSVHNRFFAQQYNTQRLMLACYEMAFRHPVSGEPMRITCPLQYDFYQLVESFGWQTQLPLDLRKAAP